MIIMILGFVFGVHSCLSRVLINIYKWRIKCLSNSLPLFSSYTIRVFIFSNTLRSPVKRFWYETLELLNNNTHLWKHLFFEDNILKTVLSNTKIDIRCLKMFTLTFVLSENEKSLILIMQIPFKRTYFLKFNLSWKHNFCEQLIWF